MPNLYYHWDDLQAVMSFNSLFEMRALVRNDPVLNARVSFNSLFEMLALRMSSRSKKRGGSFNSLFEMPAASAAPRCFFARAIQFSI